MTLISDLIFLQAQLHPNQATQLQIQVITVKTMDFIFVDHETYQTVVTEHVTEGFCEQWCVMTSWYGNVFLITDSLWEESIGHPFRRQYYAVKFVLK